MCVTCPWFSDPTPRIPSLPPSSWQLTLPCTWLRSKKVTRSVLSSFPPVTWHTSSLPLSRARASAPAPTPTSCRYRRRGCLRQAPPPASSAVLSLLLWARSWYSGVHPHTLCRLQPLSLFSSALCSAETLVKVARNLGCGPAQSDLSLSPENLFFSDFFGPVGGVAFSGLSAQLLSMQGPLSLMLSPYLLCTWHSRGFKNYLYGNDSQSRISSWDLPSALLSHSSKSRTWQPHVAAPLASPT